jgi:hypothetical protein
VRSMKRFVSSTTRPNRKFCPRLASPGPLPSTTITPVTRTNHRRARVTTVARPTMNFRTRRTPSANHALIVRESGPHQVVSPHAALHKKRQPHGSPRIFRMQINRLRFWRKGRLSSNEIYYSHPHPPRNNWLRRVEILLPQYCKHLLLRKM